MAENDQIVPLTEDELGHLSDLETQLSEWDKKDKEKLSPEEQGELTVLTDEFNELSGRHQAWQDSQSAQEPSGGEPDEKALEELRQQEKAWLVERGLGDFDTIEDVVADFSENRDNLTKLEKLNQIARQAGYVDAEQMAASAMQKRVDGSQARKPSKSGDAGALPGSDMLNQRLSYTFWRIQNAELRLLQKDHPELKSKDLQKIGDLATQRFWDSENPVEDAYVFYEAQKKVRSRSTGGTGGIFHNLQKTRLMRQTRIPIGGGGKPKLSKEEQEKRVAFGLDDKNAPFI